MDEEFEELQAIVENTNNSARKNNIRLWGLKEGVEEDQLKDYLV